MGEMYIGGSVKITINNRLPMMQKILVEKAKERAYKIVDILYKTAWRETRGPRGGKKYKITWGFRKGQTYQASEIEQFPTNPHNVLRDAITNWVDYAYDQIEQSGNDITIPMGVDTEAVPYEKFLQAEESIHYRPWVKLTFLECETEIKSILDDFWRDFNVNANSSWSMNTEKSLTGSSASMMEEEGE